MKSVSKRTYNMTDAELAMFTSNLIVFMTRDATEFAAKGVDALAITALETLGDAFEVFPNDEYYRADVTLAVEAKDAARENCEVQARAVIGCARIKWGDSSAQVKRFGAGSMTNEPDKKCLTTMRQVVTVATDYLLDLAAEGLTQAMIDALDAEAQTMEDEMNDIAGKEAVRDLKTQERIDKGNELYGFVTKYCEIGKIIWQDVDEAKYNDYVIYPAGSDLPGKVLNMDYDMPADTVSWDPAMRATDYKLERMDGAGPDWNIVYEGADTSVVDGPLSPGSYTYRCRAHNAEGYGVWSDVLLVLIPS